ncbi:succinylglutamate desuccinylase/aspartoacylase family protein [Natrinema pallidum]|uniref:PKD domain-containing protein n=1 Tax=Natrinema pallidum TaxID=69527 RepID=UPI001586AA85|nr:succinylglutamate desuccinylase/aspartoacylase family protein [Natrinema pallidum]
MRRDTLSRRSVLAATGGLTLITTGVASVVSDTARDDSGDSSRDSIVVRGGTAEETTVSVTTGAADGPTAVVVGGMHGNEVAGYTAAGRIADWSIDAGTLVTIPEANTVAIERGTRTDDEGTNLNRQFPDGETPGTRLARALWDVVSESDPDILIDLHESTGLYAGDPVDGVGQAIFHSAGDDATAAAADAAEYVTETRVDDPALAFQTGPFSEPDTEPTGLLAHKAARDLDADGFLVETRSTDIALETRVQWHTAIVDRLLERERLLNDEPSEEPVDGSDGDAESPTASPIARIETQPPSAAEAPLEPGTTVTLDASQSHDPDGKLVAYEWRVGDDGPFEEAGETIAVPINGTGDHPVALRVVDDEGATATDRLTLSTNC